MDVSDVSRIVADGLEVHIIVSPRAGRIGTDGVDEWRRRLVVKVKAPPLDGKANGEVEDLFKRLTGSRSKITSGHLSRQKTVTVYGDPAEIMDALREWT